LFHLETSLDENTEGIEAFLVLCRCILCILQMQHWHGHGKIFGEL